MSVTLRRRKLPSGHTTLYLDITGDGRRAHEFLHLLLVNDRLQDRETLKRAKAIRDKRATDILDGRLGPMPGKGRKQNFIEYAESLAATRRAKSTRASWGSALRQFKEFAGEHVTLGAVDRQMLQKFIKFLRRPGEEGGVHDNTVDFYLKKVKAVLNEALKSGYLNQNIWHDIKVETERHEPTHLTLDEVKALMKTPARNLHMKNAFLFSCSTGLRWSDVSTLTWSKIGADGTIHLSQMKTREDVTVPPSPESKRILEHQRQAPESKYVKLRVEGAVFCMPHATKVNELLKKWAKAAGIKKRLTFHVSRHTFAMLALENGVDIYTLSKLMGHSSVRMTEIYARATTATKRAAMNRLPTFEE